MQIARPIADVVASNWVVAPLWSKVNQNPDVANDAINISAFGIVPIDSGYANRTLSLSSMSNPGVATGHFLRCRCFTPVLGTAIGFGLFSGSATVCSGSFVPLLAWSTQIFALSPVQAVLISDYTMLSVSLASTDASVYVSAVEFNAPDGPTIVVIPRSDRSMLGTSIRELRDRRLCHSPEGNDNEALPAGSEVIKSKKDTKSFSQWYRKNFPEI